MGRGRPPNGAEWLTIQLCRAFEAHVLSEPEQAWAAPPLPAAFGSAAELYSSMNALVLDEAFAMVREGLASRKRALTLRMRIDGTLRASERGARLAALSVTAVGASAPDLSSALRSGSVFLLSRGECQLLAVLDGRSQAWASRNPNPSANPNPDPDSDPDPNPTLTLTLTLTRCARRSARWARARTTTSRAAKCLPPRVGCATDVAVPHEQLHRPCRYRVQSAVCLGVGRAFSPPSLSGLGPQKIKRNKYIFF